MMTNIIPIKDRFSTKITLIESSLNCAINNLEMKPAEAMSDTFVALLLMLSLCSEKDKEGIIKSMIEMLKGKVV